jgi:ribosomal protein L11 methylase PrmA
MHDGDMTAVGGSFRDPSGHVFRRDGRVLRQVNQQYAADYDHLVASGLYDRLAERRLLVAHHEITEPPDRGTAYRVLEPELIPFISYPFEWAFSQLKAAALATLAIQRLAVEEGMVLKDASAYNIQFVGAAPVLIDSLSFERWVDGTPWVAYRQFCQHFLGPLALMSVTDVRLGSLSRVFIDGPPLDLVSHLLPLTSRFQPSLLVHLHVHAKAQAKHGAAEIAQRKPTAFTKRAMLGLVDHLESAVERLTYKPGGTAWADYYAHTNYSEAAMAEKHRLVSEAIGAASPGTVWDLGANTGAFSRIAADAGAYTVAIDGDPAAVERAALAGQAGNERRILPLVMDLSNPSSAMGWAHQERGSLADRGPADLVLALGLIHHLTLSNHVPFGMTAEFFARIGRRLVIEFVPQTDSQVVAMFSRMPKAADGYSQAAFEEAYRCHFDIAASAPIAGTERRLYEMHRREGRAS